MNQPNKLKDDEQASEQIKQAQTDINNLNTIILDNLKKTDYEH